MKNHKPTKRRWSATFGHGIKKNHSAYATWDYFYQVAKSRRLSVAEMLERAVRMYAINDTPSIQEMEDFREDLQDRIRLLKYRIGTSHPTELDQSILEFYIEILEDSDYFLTENQDS